MHGSLRLRLFNQVGLTSIHQLNSLSAHESSHFAKSKTSPPLCIRACKTDIFYLLDPTPSMLTILFSGAPGHRMVPQHRLPTQWSWSEVSWFPPSRWVVVYGIQSIIWCLQRSLPLYLTQGKIRTLYSKTDPVSWELKDWLSLLHGIDRVIEPRCCM